MTVAPAAQASGAGLWASLFAVWLVSLIATLGSLFFSEVMGLAPCKLCWYQRICMYPLVPITAVALWRGEPTMTIAATPLVAVGLLVSAYHNLLYHRIIPTVLVACASDAPCTQRQIEWLRFITIPLLALTAFALCLVGLVTVVRLLPGRT